MMVAEPPRMTPTQARFLDLLSDGRHHAVEEFHALLWDDQAGREVIYVHVSTLRAKLADSGRTVVCRKRGGVVGYQLGKLPA